MRIGFETERLHGPPNGPRTYRHRLLEALLDHHSELDLVAFQFSNACHELFDHPRVENVVCRPIPGLLERRLDDLGVDVLHLGAGIHRYPFLWQVDTPTVTTIHGIEPLVLQDVEIPFRTRIQKKYIWPLFAKFLDRIIVVSNSAKRQLLEYYPIGAEKATVIYNGIDHSQYNPRSMREIKSTIEKYDIERPYFIAVGGFSERKNPGTLVSAFDRAADQITDYSLGIVGPGWGNSKVDRLVGRSDNSERICRLGRVSHGDLPSLYSGATGLVSPTLHENFGLTLVEAMACGTPVVASNVFAVPEATGDAAILIDDPNDVAAFSAALVRLATDDRFRETHTTLGLQRAKRFTWERCAGEVFELYQSLV